MKCLSPSWENEAVGNYVYFHFESIRGLYVSEPCRIMEQTLEMTPKCLLSHTLPLQRGLPPAHKYTHRGCGANVQPVAFVFTQFSVLNERSILSEWDLDTYRKGADRCIDFQLLLLNECFHSLLVNDATIPCAYIKSYKHISLCIKTKMISVDF